jgi:hypothetical protein
MRPGTRATENVRHLPRPERRRRPPAGPRTHPTRGGPDHRAESERFCAAFPDNKVKHPYDILFGDGELPGQQGDEQTPDTEESK